MPSISSDQIRDISIKTVEGFLNNKVPLSVGLAKQASMLELNPEQIKRSIEATNSIAYLKVLQLSDDRTSEFPLCKYAEVMAHIAMPNEVIVKKASAVGKSTYQAQFVPTPLNDAESRVAFNKMASLNQGILQNLKDRAVTIVPEMIKLASTIKKDERALEKLATVSADSEFNALSTLVFGSIQIHSDTGLFKSAELKEVTSLKDLYKEAKELQVSIAEKQSLADRSELVKVAFLGAAVEGFGKIVGKGLGAAIAKPIGTLGKGIANSSSNMGNAAANKVKSAFGMKTTPLVKKLGVGAVIGTVATVGLDSALYSPGKHADGSSKDAWTALQRQ